MYLDAFIKQIETRNWRYISEKLATWVRYIFEKKFVTYVQMH